LLRFGTLSRDAHNVSLVFLANALDLLLEGLGLDGTSGGGVGGVEVHDEGLLVLGSVEGLAVLVDEAEIRRGLADGEVQGRVPGAGGGGSECRGGSTGDGDEGGGGLHGWNKIFGVCVYSSRMLLEYVDIMSC